MVEPSDTNKSLHAVKAGDKCPYNDGGVVYLHSYGHGTWLECNKDPNNHFRRATVNEEKDLEPQIFEEIAE